MPDYKYTLQRWSGRDKSVCCPRCHKGGGQYKEYVYTDNGQPIDPIGHTCGRCDHEKTCGYHLTPREYFASNPTERRTIIASAPERQKQRIEIPMKIVKDTCAKYNKNIFVKWLYTLPWDKEQKRVLGAVIIAYYLGTTNNGRIIWWQIDAQNVVRTGKIMRYNPDGHRTKDADGNSVDFNWVHALMRMQGHYPAKYYELVQCLFGEHLLRENKDAEVHIVESEKTAVIMSILDAGAFEKRIWVATGGKKNLKPEKLIALRGRKVVAYPDRDAVDEWRERLQGTDVQLATKWIDLCTDDDSPKADISDVMLRRMLATDDAKLAEIKQKYPPIKKLIETLNLEICHN